MRIKNPFNKILHSFYNLNIFLCALVAKLKKQLMDQSAHGTKQRYWDKISREFSTFLIPWPKILETPLLWLKVSSLHFHSLPNFTK